jgi:putative transposase
MYDWRKGRSCVYKNNVHLVFVTKYRRNALTLELLNDLKMIVKETCEQLDCELLEFGGEDRHAHFMVSAHPKIALSNLIGKLKGKSSFVLRKNHWEHIKPKLWGNHFWSPSYCVLSVGGASLDVIKAYSENQRKPPSEKQINQSRKISAKSQELA